MRFSYRRPKNNRQTAQYNGVTAIRGNDVTVATSRSPRDSYTCKRASIRRRTYLEPEPLPLLDLAWPIGISGVGVFAAFEALLSPRIDRYRYRLPGRQIYLCLYFRYARKVPFFPKEFWHSCRLSLRGWLRWLWLDWRSTFWCHELLLGGYRRLSPGSTNVIE